MSETFAHAGVTPPTNRLGLSVPRLAALRLNTKASHISLPVASGTIRFIEFLLVAGLGFAIASLYVGKLNILENWNYAIALALTSLTSIVIFQMLGLYRIQSFTSHLGNLPRLLLGWTLSLGLLTAAVFLVKLGPEFSRGWLLLWYVAGAILLMVERFATAKVTRAWARHGRLNRRAVIYGGGEDCLKLLKVLEEQPENDIRIVGIFDDRGGERDASSIAGYPVLGSSTELIAFGRKNRLDMLILSVPLKAEARILEIMKRLWVLPVDIRLAAHTTRLRFRPHSYSFIGAVPLLDLYDKPIADWDRVAKWAFDKIVGTLAAIAFMPLMAMVAIAIKLDSKGPVLFRQKRYGFNNELIEVYKFRSMFSDMSDANATKLVSKGDPRVTRVGRFIRKTSLDELPQLFNVLNGSLSLVGPRPHALQAKAADKLYNDVVDGYFARHKVKPGITGWAQINGWRGETDTPLKIQKRVEHDLYYIENWSVFLDAYILLATPLSLLKSENAY